MKEGRLSSDLQERYGISNKDAIGKVLWHSLNENGEIGVYDMKFGNTIVRDLLAENIEEGDIKEHPQESMHGVQEEGDADRATLEEQ